VVIAGFGTITFAAGIITFAAGGCCCVVVVRGVGLNWRDDAAGLKSSGRRGWETRPVGDDGME